MDKHQDGYKAGFVAVMGHPNVGKSSLINALLGQKIAAVTPRPQTTRKRQLGILTQQDAQIIFIDTPGIHQPRHKLGESMVEEAQEALEESDVILFLVDASQEPTEEDRLLSGFLRTLKRRQPLILALNKADLVSQAEIDARKQAYAELVPAGFNPAVLAISAIQGMNMDKLLQEIIERLPLSDPFFPDGQITDYYERDIAGELIREAALLDLRDEVPHGVTVRVDEFTERGETGAYIAATLFVERESHKGIVIGQGGAMLKKIGSDARREIEAMTGRKVFLELRVKVRKNWRNDEKALRQLGFSVKKGK